MLERGAARVGAELRARQLDSAAGTDELAARLEELNADRRVHGVLLQAPLPPGVDQAELAARIAPAKDVDGASPTSAVRLLRGRPGFVPATAAAVMEILRGAGVPLSGARAVVLGRSMVVGRPAALLLLAADATVTVCHSRTRDLEAVTRQADVLVVAVGRPRLVGAGFVKPGATVIDVGTTPTAAAWPATSTSTPCRRWPAPSPPSPAASAPSPPCPSSARSSRRPTTRVDRPPSCGYRDGRGAPLR